MNVLFVGQWPSEKALACRKAANIAAVTWTRKFLSALAENGASVSLLTHAREQLWPRGSEILPGEIVDFRDDYPFTWVRYFNLPYLRTPSLKLSYKRAARACAVPDVVLTYNLLPECVVVGRTLAKRGALWIPIVLDWYGEDLSRSLEDAAGVIILSRWLYDHFPLEIPRLYLDGGIDLLETKPLSAKTVVYSGSYGGGYGDVDVLFKIIQAVKTTDVRFVLTGKDPYGILQKDIARYPSVEYRGMVSSEELADLCSQASVFINPRDPQVLINRYTFPSKLLSYLAYGKPIVSTWTDGLSDEYRDVLDIASLPAFPSRIDHWLSACEDERKALARRIRSFASGHTWNAQAKRLLAFVENCGAGLRATNQKNA